MVLLWYKDAKDGANITYNYKFTGLRHAATLRNHELMNVSI